MTEKTSRFLIKKTAGRPLLRPVVDFKIGTSNLAFVWNAPSKCQRLWPFFAPSKMAAFFLQIAKNRSDFFFDSLFASNFHPGCSKGQRLLAFLCPVTIGSLLLLKNSPRNPVKSTRSSVGSSSCSRAPFGSLKCRL